VHARDVSAEAGTRGGAEAVHLSTDERGGMHRLRSEQWVPVGRNDAFGFFAEAGNLQALTPPSLQFTILTPLPIRMGVGTLIRYRLRIFGLPIGWLTRIEEWRPGKGFTDIQLRGPYARWIHTHTFTGGDGGTWVRDEVEYALPLAPASNPLHAAFVRPMLERIFAYRRDAIARLLGEA
jgi:ligand-binding SRPBCC domain-containing protein